MEAFVISRGNLNIYRYNGPFLIRRLKIILTLKTCSCLNLIHFKTIYDKMCNQ